ncbi:MAG: alpha/beta hydrolase [SAR324 cluster bacterium]
MNVIRSSRPLSWRCRLLNGVLRAFVKPKLARGMSPAWTRRWLSPSRGPWVRIPRGLDARAESAGGVPGEWLEHQRSSAEADRVIYYLHGGGYVWGHPRMYRPLNAALALGTGARVFCPEYRLAPEHPLPAARDDALAGYRWLLSRGVPSSRMIVAGESAGGGLTLTLLLALRDAGVPLPAGAVALSPWTDLACTGESLAANDRSCAMLAAAAIRSAAKLALGNLDPTDPGASPLYGDFHGLPPLLVLVSEDETLRDDALRVAERAGAHGVDVTLRIARGVPHAWPYYQGIIPEAREAARTMTAFMRECWVRAESASPASSLR